MLSASRRWRWVSLWPRGLSIFDIGSLTIEEDVRTSERRTRPGAAGFLWVQSDLRRGDFRLQPRGSLRFEPPDSATAALQRKLLGRKRSSTPGLCPRGGQQNCRASGDRPPSSFSRTRPARICIRDLLGSDGLGSDGLGGWPAQARASRFRWRLRIPSNRRPPGGSRRRAARSRRHARARPRSGRRRAFATPAGGPSGPPPDRRRRAGSSSPSNGSAGRPAARRPAVRLGNRRW